MLKISFAGCLGLTPVISMQFTLEMCVAASNRDKNSLKPIFWGSWSFKVIDVGTWYRRKAHQQCLLWCAASLCLSATVLLLDWTTVAETAHFEWRTRIWCTRTEDSLNLRDQIYFLCRTFHMQVVLVYLEWFRRNSLFKCVSQPKITKNSRKTPILGFKVVQGHRCWYHWKARHQCLLW